MCAKTRQGRSRTVSALTLLAHRRRAIAGSISLVNCGIDSSSRFHLERLCSGEWLSVQMWSSAGYCSHACGRKGKRSCAPFCDPATGLLLNELFGLWWADLLAALVMAPIIAKEGIEASSACGRSHVV